ncbi:unnamed protein product, partial [Polarella glacialis]
AIEKAGYKGVCSIGMDVAASEFKVEGKDCYDLGLWYPESERGDASLKMTGAQLGEFYAQLCKDFPIITIEDPFDQDDWAAWEALTKALGTEKQVVGDDLTVTNVTRVKKAIDQKACNALLLKVRISGQEFSSPQASACSAPLAEVNQIGSVTESIDAVKMCKQSGWGVMTSHRSGETEVLPSERAVVDTLTRPLLISPLVSALDRSRLEHPADPNSAHIFVTFPVFCCLCCFLRIDGVLLQPLKSWAPKLCTRVPAGASRSGWATEPTLGDLFQGCEFGWATEPAFAQPRLWVTLFPRLRCSAVYLQRAIKTSLTSERFSMLLALVARGVYRVASSGGSRASSSGSLAELEEMLDRLRSTHFQGPPASGCDSSLKLKTNNLWASVRPVLRGGKELRRLLQHQPLKHERECRIVQLVTDLVQTVGRITSARERLKFPQDIAIEAVWLCSSLLDAHVATLSSSTESAPDPHHVLRLLAFALPDAAPATSTPGSSSQPSSKTRSPSPASGSIQSLLPAEDSAALVRSLAALLQRTSNLRTCSLSISCLGRLVEQAGLQVAAQEVATGLMSSLQLMASSMSHGNTSSPGTLRDVSAVLHALPAIVAEVRTQLEPSALALLACLQPLSVTGAPYVTRCRVPLQGPGPPGLAALGAPPLSSDWSWSDRDTELSAVDADSVAAVRRRTAGKGRGGAEDAATVAMALQAQCRAGALRSCVQLFKLWPKAYFGRWPLVLDFQSGEVCRSSGGAAPLPMLLAICQQDLSPKVRAAALASVCALLEAPSVRSFPVPLERDGVGNSAGGSLSEQLAKTLRQSHSVVFKLVQCSNVGDVQNALRACGDLASSTPYTKLKPGLLTEIVQRLVPFLRGMTDLTCLDAVPQVVSAAVAAMGVALKREDCAAELQSCLFTGRGQSGVPLADELVKSVLHVVSLVNKLPSGASSAQITQPSPTKTRPKKGAAALDLEPGDSVVTQECALLASRVLHFRPAVLPQTTVEMYQELVSSLVEMGHSGFRVRGFRLLSDLLEPPTTTTEGLASTEAPETEAATQAARPPSQLSPSWCAGLARTVWLKACAPAELSSTVRASAMSALPGLLLTAIQRQEAEGSVTVAPVPEALATLRSGASDANATVRTAAAQAFGDRYQTCVLRAWTRALGRTVGEPTVGAVLASLADAGLADKEEAPLAALEAGILMADVADVVMMDAAASAPVTRQAQETEMTRAFREVAGRMVDMRGVAKPPNFTGLETDWAEWKFRMEAILSLLGLDDLAEAAVREGVDADARLLSDADELRSKMLYNLLVQLCSGKALSLVRTVRRADGLGSWAKLVRDYEPSVAARHCAKLSSLLCPGFEDSKPFTEQLLEWERRITDYELVTKAMFPDAYKCAVISRWAPKRVREFLRVNTSDLTASYVELKRALRDLQVRSQTFDAAGQGSQDQHSEYVPMIVDALKGVQGKGKGQAFDGKCFQCGKEGHRARDCRQKPIAELAEPEPHPLDGQDSQSWFMMLAEAASKTRDIPKEEQGLTLMLVDSGSCAHVCPKDFAPSQKFVPQEWDKLPQAAAVDGHPVRAYGWKPVHMQLEDGRPLFVNFLAMDVTRPILSVAELVKSGYEMWFGSLEHPQPFIRKGGVKMRLIRHANLFFLPVRQQEQWKTTEPLGRQQRRRQRQQGQSLGECRWGPELATCTADQKDFWDESSGDDVPRSFQSAWEAKRAAEAAGQDGAKEFARQAMWNCQHSDQQQAKSWRGGFIGALPSADERKAHEVTHLPYQQWCPVCVSCKAADSPHHRLPEEGADDTPVVEFDYGFVSPTGQADECEAPVVLVARAKQSGYSFATVVKVKGAGDTAAVQGVLGFLQEAGLPGQRLRLRSDQEGSIRACVSRIAAQRAAETIVETTPKGSSNSLGAAERFIRTLMTQVATLCTQVQQQWDVELKADSPLLPWVVGHAAWLLNRFQPYLGETPFHRVQGHEYRGEVYAFGQPLLVRTVESQSRLQPRWDAGIFLGKLTSSDEFVVATEAGIRRGRSVKEAPGAMTDYLARLRWTQDSRDEGREVS